MASKTRSFFEFGPIERCAAAGACLDSSEKKKMLKKAGCRTKDLSEIDVHRTLVRLSGNDESFAVKIGSILEKRYRRQGMEWFIKPEGKRISLWREALNRSDFAHMLWTGLLLGDDNLREALVKDFRAHQIQSVKVASDRLRTIDRLQREKERLEERYRKSKARERQAKREARESHVSVGQMSVKLERLEEENRHARESDGETDLKEMNAGLADKLSSLESKLAWEEEALVKLELQLEKLERENDELRKMNQAATEEIESLLARLREKEVDCTECPKQSCCSRNVLLVGGITKLEAVYRSVVEKTGGDFRYHTGRYVGGEEMLRDRISWADVVLCPVDVNSHRAALGVKKICRKLDKPFVMLRTSSVSGVARALDELSAQPGV